MKGFNAISHSDLFSAMTCKLASNVLLRSKDQCSDLDLKVMWAFINYALTHECFKA